MYPNCGVKFVRSQPRHVGIILDGNRRYARKHGLADPRVAYDLGAEKLDDVLAWCSDLATPAVTLWVCSIDNLRRPQARGRRHPRGSRGKDQRPGAGPSHAPPPGSV
jgi:undecaprenyl pyrophosphate synthase